MSVKKHFFDYIEEFPCILGTTNWKIKWPSLDAAKPTFFAAATVGGRGHWTLHVIMLISSRAGNVSTLPRSMIILYIILVMKFVFRKAREKTKNEFDEPATSFFDHFTMWYSGKFASTKCIPVQPRTYDELQRVFNFVYWQISRQYFLIKSFWGGFLMPPPLSLSSELRDWSKV